MRSSSFARSLCCCHLACVIAVWLGTTGVVCPATAVAQHDRHAIAGDTSSITSARLGRVVFPNSGAPAAQRSFLRGVALAHSFSTHAPEAFREAQRADPGFALAYWLEAYAWRDPLGRSEQLDSARASLLRLGQTREARLAKARTPRERAWGAAIEALFADDSVPTRTTAFADSMRALVRRDPSDVEARVVASFALQSIPRLPLARRGPMRAEAAALAVSAFRDAPEHPGAAHAVIHVFDDNRPGTAEQALAAARAYDRIAPDNGHALHMPSHIFLQLGLWEEVEASNRRAIEMANRNRAARLPAARESDWHMIDWHAFNWLYFALVQQGRIREARALDDSARRILAAAPPGVVDSLGDPDARVGPAMRALQMAALSGDWQSLGTTGPRMTAPEISAMRTRGVVDWIEPAFLPGLSAAARSDTAAARAAVRRISEEAAREPPGTVRSERAKIWVGEIEGVAAWVARDTASALAHLDAAAAADDTLSVSGPSRWWPGGELVGLALLDFGRPADAARAFARTLDRFPRRPSAQLGLARARLAAGDTAGARAAYSALLTLWRRADQNLPAAVEARERR
jgi:tetratricopeptide (TPR) repeat protein